MSFISVCRRPRHLAMDGADAGQVVPTLQRGFGGCDRNRRPGGHRGVGLESRSEVQIAQQPKAGVPAERYVPSTARARKELGLRQTVPLGEAIGGTARTFCMAGGVR